jgi:adenylate cyclase
MAADGDRAVLFADLVGSTRLYESLGDREAHAVVAGCLGGIREAVERFDGNLVKTIGDGVMATFVSADAAFRCAEAIVTGMRCAALGSDRPLGVHVGFHFGPVLEANGDVFGDTVNVAARLMQLAENQRIFTTGSTTLHLEEPLRARLLRVGRVAIRGRRDPVDLFELTTGNETLTRWVDVPREEEADASGAWLEIHCAGSEHVLRGAGGGLTIGRDASNDLVLKSPSASRFHARVERRSRGWYLVDRSRNGTLVVPDGGSPTRLRREDVRIEGSGTLRVAGPVNAQIDEPIRYELRDLETS